MTDELGAGFRILELTIVLRPHRGVPVRYRA